MRLTCPSCGARYDVPRDVIPDEGRDVQCSSCGHTWFQPAPRTEALQPGPPLTEPEPEATPPALRTEAPADRSDTVEEDEVDFDDTGDAPDTPPPHTPPPPPRDLPGPMRDIFREEREHEERLRREGGLESQPDLGLVEPDADTVARERRERRERMTRSGRPASDPAWSEDGRTAPRAAPARRDLLPDVDEISDSLRSDRPVRRAAPPPPDTGGGPGFAGGFFVAVLIGGAAAAAYVWSGFLADFFPFAEPQIAAYAAWVDGLRAWLDVQAGALTATLDALSSEAETGGS